MRVRRRLAVSAVIALAVAIIGGGPLAHDPHVSRLVTRDKSRVSDSISGAALSPTNPVSSDGEVDGLTPVVPAASNGAGGGTQAVRRNQEAVIQAAPSHFEGPAPRSVAPPAAINETPVASQGTGGTWAVVIGVNDYPGTANDLYGMIRYLCSDDAGWVTGQTFAVDGGFTFRP